ncbi:ABC-type molybdate transport system, substrate-binding protein [Candidatus Methanophagaceae archaeon]|nr:ABC-type molybdate transport system, substrate-binding protein [Methanophagales archaeon]
MESRKIFALGIVIACVSVAAFYVSPVGAEQDQTIKIFHAGSLAVPLEEVEKQFEAVHPNVDVRRESLGSIAAIRQVTDVGKNGDVVASADYTLIPSMMYLEYADWVVRFATNDLVLAYNPEKSKYAEEITPDNWYEILRRDDVVYAFSNPNLDPCGYRAVMVFQLAELYTGDDMIFDDLISDNTAITISEEEGTYLIKTPEDMKPNTDKVSIRPKSVELVAMVEEGGLDYAFEYRSVAVQHNLSYVDLPTEIDLGNAAYEDFYNKVKLQRADGETITASTIIYGITVPKNADNPELGLEFVEFVIGDAGQKIFGDRGQTPIVPALGSGNLPAELKPYTKQMLTLATGSPYELGLINGLAKPFEENYDCIVEVTKASTGQGLDLGRKGKVDLTLGHSKEALDTYIEEGYGTDRKAVMHNYFVIVGPEDDPAGIGDISNLTEAHRRIANTKSLYLSRGDEGGMHKGEKAILKELAIDPSEEDWYLVSHDFMMASLRMANDVGAYHMADSSTFTAMSDKLSGLDLLVVGDPNRYEVAVANPEKYPNVNYDLAKAFSEYITSEEGQTIIGDFGIDEYGEPLYHPDAVKNTLTLATGSPYELGLIDALSKPFEERYGCKVEVTKAGSGASLDLGREGKVDLVMVHAPGTEEQFVEDGYGLNRTYMMYNDFVIVGPKDDPAGIQGMTDVAEAYKRIANTNSLFFSRGDNSGTHKKEMAIWASAGVTPKGAWYKETDAFMGDTLKIANTEQGYFMTDRSTYVTLKKDLDLDILVEGDPVLVNHYHAIAVNPAKHPTVNYELAKEFIAFVSSPEGQEVIGDFGKDEFGEPLYLVAAPSPTVTSSPVVLPTTVPPATTMPSPAASPTPQTPCFGVVFAVTALLAVSYVRLRKRRE